jgi:hypothetical protein
VNGLILIVMTKGKKTNITSFQGEDHKGLGLILVRVNFPPYHHADIAYAREMKFAIHLSLLRVGSRPAFLGLSLNNIIASYTL